MFCFNNSINSSKVNYNYLMYCSSTVMIYEQTPWGVAFQSRNLCSSHKLQKCLNFNLFLVLLFLDLNCILLTFLRKIRDRPNGSLMSFVVTLCEYIPKSELSAVSYQNDDHNGKNCE